MPPAWADGAVEGAHGSFHNTSKPHLPLTLSLPGSPTPCTCTSGYVGAYQICMCTHDCLGLREDRGSDQGTEDLGLSFPILAWIDLTLDPAIPKSLLESIPHGRERQVCAPLNRSQSVPSSSVRKPHLSTYPPSLTAPKTICSQQGHLLRVKWADIPAYHPDSVMQGTASQHRDPGVGDILEVPPYAPDLPP